MTTFFQRATLMIADASHANCAPSRLIPLMREAGIANVAIKVCEGVVPENAGSLEASARAFLSAGCGVAFWGVHHAAFPGDECALVVAAKQEVPGASAYFADTEQEFKYGGPFPPPQGAAEAVFARSDAIFSRLAPWFPDAMAAVPLGEPKAAWPAGVWSKRRVRVCPQMYAGQQAVPFDAAAKQACVVGIARQGVDARFMHPTYRVTDPHPASFFYRGKRILGLVIFAADFADDDHIRSWAAAREWFV